VGYMCCFLASDAGATSSTVTTKSTKDAATGG
jgi:hypothetical protein